MWTTTVVAKKKNGTALKRWRKSLSMPNAECAWCLTPGGRYAYQPVNLADNRPEWSHGPGVLWYHNVRCYLEKQKHIGKVFHAWWDHARTEEICSYGEKDEKPGKVQE